MANIKISELDELVNVADNDYLPIVDTSENETKKVAIQRIGAGGKSGDTLPIGSIVPYGNETAPANWLICDGSAISRTTYADLFAVIGTTFGSGDGSTTFNLPNMKGKVAVGLDSNDNDFDTIGKSGGEKEVTLTIDKIPEHQHGEYIEYNGRKQPYTLSLGGGTSKSGYFLNAQTTAYSGPQVLTEKTGGGQSHNNLQPYQVQNYIIKAFQSAGVIGNVVKVKTNSDTDTYSCNYINDATQKQIISVETGSNFNFTINEYTEINTWKLYNQNGNKFSVENGKVKVGAGISKVKITATLSIDNQAQDTIFCYPKLNGVSLSPWCLFNLNYSGTLTFSTMCTVKENDIISCALYSTKNANINAGRANMIIEAVE